jgi:cytosine/adenosine deaminase-related metal-dependent hydrolase
MIRMTQYMMALCSLVTTLWAQQQSPLPEMPFDIPKDAVIRMVLTDKAPSGQDAVWKTPDGAVHEFFQFNDRGRGPKIYTTYHVDSNGLVIAEESKGVDYMKSSVEEHFSLNAGEAAWKNQSEDEKHPDAAGKFYIDIDGGPEAGAILARALLRQGNDGKLAVLPGGEATIRKLQSVPVEANGKKATAVLYEVSGLAFTPNYIWLDEDQQFLANISGWFSVVRQGLESAVPNLREMQRTFETARSAELAQKLTHKPTGDLVITNIALFDSATGKVMPDQRVVARGDRIVSVDPDQGQTPTAGATVIDGKGKMLLPGLWDMHAHLFADLAYLDIANGVTTARDMGNSIDELTKLRQNIAAGKQIGPRVVLAGFIDGPGPYEGPIKVLAATPEEAKQRVDHYSELGYVQIKIYSSVKPELVPIIAQEAHRLGLRVSGHVPANMTAQQFVLDGADEIQHMNFVFLNFMPDVKETRTPARFIEPGKRGADIDLNSQPVNDFIALLKQHHTVIDPTMGVWESTYLSRPGQVPALDAPMFDRLPVQVQRGIKTGGDALSASDPATDKQYRASYANMVRMVNKLYDNGIQIVAGTDAGSGYAFDRELEIYNQAGIPASAVLRIATIEAATVMHMEKDFGSVTPGKYADMILVSGDPTQDISDIRKVDTVIKGGEVLRPAEMYPAYGIRAE